MNYDRTIVITGFVSDGPRHGFTYEVNGRRRGMYAFLSGVDIPDFFHELFLGLCLVAPHGVIWPRRGGVPKGRFLVDVNVPISEACVRFMNRVTVLSGLDVSVRTRKIASDFDYHDSDGGWLVPFSGGKDSGLIYCIFDELGCDMSLLHAVQENTLWYPDRKVTQVRMSQWNQGSLAMGVACAIADGHSRVAYGFNYNAQVPTPDVYSVEWNDFLVHLNDYLSLHTDVRCSSPISNIPGLIVQRILHERYPDFIQTYTPAYGHALQRMMNLYLGRPFPDTFDDTVDLAVFVPSDEMSWRIANMELQNIYVRLKGHPMLGDNPLQEGEVVEWLDKYQKRDAQPLYLPDGFEDIIREHAEPDHNWHLHEITSF